MARSITTPARRPVWALVVAVAWLLASNSSQPAAGADEPLASLARVRSPVAVAVAPGDMLAATANRAAGSVSIVDVRRGAVVAEIVCGPSPVAVAWLDAARVAVALASDDAVAIVAREDAGWRLAARWSVGREPSDVAAVGPADDRRLWVAVASDDALVELSPADGRLLRRAPVGRLPRRLAAGPDGRLLVAACELPGEIWTLDTATGATVSRREVFGDAFHLGRPAIAPDGAWLAAPHTANRSFPVDKGNIARGWVVNNRLARLPLPTGGALEQQRLGLDRPGRGVGDLEAAAFSRDGRWLAAAAGGAQELLVLPVADIPWPAGDPEDFAPHRLVETPGLLRRIELGGRPADLAALGASDVVVANHLLDAVQVVDLAAAAVRRTIPLGPPHQPDLVRRGEAIFYDARRSLDGWFSCHTCHTEGSTLGQVFDTLNDGGYGAYKLAPPLLGVGETGPWTWHGWQGSLADAAVQSLTSTMSTPRPPTDEDAAALVAYLETLYARRGRAAGDDEARAALARGREIFEGRGGCVSCHRGPTFTTPTTHAVGLETPGGAYTEFNPPSLRGAADRRRFLHDGRARRLRDVLEHYHRPERVAGERLTPAELDDLLRYVESL